MSKLKMEDVRKEQVIRAATSCIIEKGLSNLSMKAIAAEADVSAGVIYHYFENKEDVLLQVLKESFRQSHELVVEKVEPLQTAAEKLTKHIENINTVPRDNTEFYAVLLNYLGEAKHNPEIRNIIAKFFNNLKSYTNQYVADLSLEEKRKKNLAVITYALGLGLGIMWTIDDQLYDIEEMDQSLNDLFSTFIGNGRGDSHDDSDR